MNYGVGFSSLDCLVWMRVSCGCDFGGDECWYSVMRWLMWWLWDLEVWC